MPVFLFSQKENNVWFFGTDAGINFNTPTPTTMNSAGTMNAYEGCASVCDNTGNLLFYTNAVTIFDKNHNIMPNGSGILGGASSTMAALILPKQNDCSKYYVFTTGDHITGGYFYYSIVDMCLNGGLGDVTSTKNVLINSNSAEKLTAIKHANGKDVWIVTHLLGSDVYNAYLLTASGFSMIPVSSSVGVFTPSNCMIGYMKASQDGKKIASCTTFGNTLELLDFDPSTGIVSNPQNLTSLLSLPGGFYGLNFAPHDSILYAATTTGANKLYQIKLYPTLSTSVIYTTASANYIIGALQLGPDNKIYLAHNGSTALDVINNPNISGTGCNFVVGGLPLAAGCSSQMGLPNFTPYSFLPTYNSFTIDIGNDTSSCSPITLDATGACNSVYTWNTGATTNTISTTGPGTYYVHINNICGQASDTILISAGVGGSTSISGINNICAGSATTLNGSGATTYTWSGSGLSCINCPSTLVTPLGTTTYTLIGAGNCGTDTVFYTVTVNATPTVGINTTQNILCQGNATTLTANGASSYTWSAGTSCVICQNTSVTPLATTVYTVTGTNGACSDTAMITIAVNPTPTVSINTSSNSICIGDSSFLNASGASTYTWLGNGLSCTTCTNPYVKPTVTTTYSVIGSNTFCVDTSVVTITVNPIPNVTASATLYTICAGNQTILTAAGASSYTWLGSGLNCTACTSPGATPGGTSTYTVTGTSNGCSDTAVVYINVQITPTITVSGNQDICAGATTTLTAGGAVSYTWAPASGLSCTTCSSTVASPVASGNYMVIGAIGTCTNVNTILVVVYPLSNVLVNHASICSGTPAVLTASGASTYSWSPAIGLSNTIGASTSASYSTTMIYTVTGTSTAGCIGMDTALVSVSTTPIVTTTSGSVCAGSAISLSATGASTYTWSPSTGLSNTFGSTVSAGPNHTTSYTVIGTSGGCSDTAFLQVTINPLPAFTVTASQDSITIGNHTSLTADGSYTYLWDDGETASSITVSPNETTTYCIKATSAAGCTAKICHEVYVSCESALYIPNCFTPNDDNLNEVYTIPYTCITDFHIMIYNRWGELLFESWDIQHSWNGMYKGNLVSEGVYVYLIDAKGYDKTIYQKHGIVTVLR